MKIFVTSDTHFNHKNIIKYCDRPFTTLDEMNSALIHNWNSVVGNDDIVIFCGDLLFTKSRSAAAADTIRFVSALNGCKLIIKGNHDYRNVVYCDCGFNYECYQELKFGRFLFCHRPDDLSITSKEFDYVFFGHVHNSPVENQPKNCINACLDANNLLPIDITEYFTEQEIADLKSLVGKGEKYDN